MLSVEEWQAPLIAVSIMSIQESTEKDITTRHTSGITTLRGPVLDAFKFCSLQALMAEVIRK